MARRLTRNSKDSMICGVAAGVADYFDVDPVITRLGFILLACVHGVGVLFYIICCIIIPKREEAAASHVRCSCFCFCFSLKLCLQ